MVQCTNTNTIKMNKERRRRRREGTIQMSADAVKIFICICKSDHAMCVLYTNTDATNKTKKYLCYGSSI